MNLTAISEIPEYAFGCYGIYADNPHYAVEGGGTVRVTGELNMRGGEQGYDGVIDGGSVGEDAKLRVRGAHESSDYGEVVLPGEGVTAGEPGVAAPAGTVYTINKSPVQVADTSGIALLFDNISDTNNGSGVSRTALFLDRAKKVLGTDIGRYELKYLDLVDRNNGSVWVEASKPVTVYWPLPAGTDADTEFTLLHFEGLDREMDASEVASDIASCAVTDVTLTNDGRHVSFAVEPGGFSPFLLCWDADIPVYVPSLPPLLNTREHHAYIVGYEDGTFRPDAGITRAEFAKMAVSFFEYKDAAAENIFTDVAEGSWYESFIAAAAQLGLIEGYEDGSFRPDAGITRAEACTIINRTLRRSPDKDHLLPEREMRVWPDNPEEAWFYAQVQETTNSHEYRWQVSIEQWTEKMADRDWTLLEK